MKPQHILQSDVLDILFENRNKTYGAYYLRRHYNEYLLRALIATAVIMTLTILVATRNYTNNDMPPFSIPSSPPLVPFNPIQIEPPPPKVVKPPQPAAQQRLSTFKIVPVIPPEEEQVPDITDMADKQVALVTMHALPSGDIAQPPVAVQAAGNNRGAMAAPPPDSPFDVDEVDETAEYPGGLKAMMHFLQRNLHHPMEQCTESVKVKIQFVVREDGSMSSFSVIQTGGEKIDQEVIRALKKMPRWKPAKKNGKHVAMYFVQPVSFEAIE
ncbi:MAG TPA: energy transducer TonB [Agriterribacter sp.]|nr:energy transducer TonB [Agriterribacter sp.]